jgi:DNA-binding NtrC family response regulator
VGLATHDWPGNVRELRNYVERTIAFGEIESPPPTTKGAAVSGAVDIQRPLKSAREQWNARFERAYLEQILEANGGNVTAAARAAGVDRIHFYRLLWKHHLR